MDLFAVRSLCLIRDIPEAQALVNLSDCLCTQDDIHVFRLWYRKQPQTMTGVYRISFKGLNAGELKLSVSEVNYMKGGHLLTNKDLKPYPAKVEA